MITYTAVFLKDITLSKATRQWLIAFYTGEHFTTIDSLVDSVVILVADKEKLLLANRIRILYEKLYNNRVKIIIL